MTGFQKLGIIAGGGALPARIIAERKAAGEPFHLIRIAGSQDGVLDNIPGDTISIGEAGKIIKSLKTAQCDAVCLAGIVRRPEFSKLKVDWRGAKILPKIAAAAAKGDDAILSLLVRTFETEGLSVVGAQDVVSGLAASQGALGHHKPTQDDHNDIAKAAALIAAVGPFDIGQGAVVARGHVLAVEAAEGTDLMLERCAMLPGESRDAWPRGVLVKRPKPDQERRVDLPVIGPATIERAAAAGLRGIAIEADGAIILEREETISAADDADLFIYGFSPRNTEGP